MRYFVSELRLDSADTFFLGVTVPQLVSIVVIALCVPPVVYLLRRGPRDDPPEALPPGRVRVKQA